MLLYIFWWSNFSFYMSTLLQFYYVFANIPVTIKAEIESNAVKTIQWAPKKPILMTNLPSPSSLFPAIFRVLQI